MAGDKIFHIAGDYNEHKVVNITCNGNTTFNGSDYTEKKKEQEEGEESLPIDDIFKKGCITERSQMWLLLVACLARKKTFDSLPDFIRWAFSKFEIQLDQKECQDSIQDKLKGQPWIMVRDQSTMLEFIKTISKQANALEENKAIANKIFVALKDFDMG